MGISSYSVEIIEAPADSQQVGKAITERQKFPLIITSSKAIKDGAPANISNDYITRIVSCLRDSGLFLDVGANYIYLDGEKHAHYELSFSAIEAEDPHQLQVILATSCIAGLTCVMIFPVIFLFLLKFTKDFSQELSVELKTIDGGTRRYSAKTVAKLKYGIFANHNAGAANLGGTVSALNINSIVNQMIRDQASWNQ